MNAEPVNAIVLTIVFCAIGLYLLYFVIRAGVRDGIRLAAKAATAESASGDE